MTLSPPPRAKLTIATRGSPLALWQADFISGLLRDRGVASEKLIIKTTADRVQDRFLHEIGGKGLFVKELEEALLAGKADLAVHSLKDMTARLQAPFTLGAVLKRHSPADVLIFRSDVAAKLKPKGLLSQADVAALGALTVGTGSLRRQAILKRAAPEIVPVGVRGNVDTRLRKLQEGQWEALILAEASLDRLGIKDVARCRLAPDWFVPCASQGALAIETRQDDPLTAWIGRELGDADTTLAVTVEREVLARLGGDCTMPLGCLVAREGGRLVGRAMVLSREGDAAAAEYAVPYQGADGFDRSAFADALARQLRASGAGRILKALGVAVPAEFA